MCKIHDYMLKILVCCASVCSMEFFEVNWCIAVGVMHSKIV